MTEIQTVFVSRVQLYQFVEETGQYNEFGTCGCCIMGNPVTLLYKLGCYADSGTYHCTATITSNNESSVRLAVQGNGYVSFKDDESRAWSMMFASDSEALEFAANVSVAMYGAAGSPDSNIIACDVAVGKKDRRIFANDKIKVRYQSWVLQRGTPQRDVSKLGSKLESNEGDEKPYMFTVPANHVSVTTDMKGFEGMMVGGCEETQRFIVVPVNAKRGSGPNTHMCFYVNILKKKDEGKGQQQQQQQPLQQQLTGQGYGQQGGVLQIANGNQQIGHLVLAEAPHVAPPQVHAAAPPPPPPGFNLDQLVVVDRMRDQVQALTQQLREAHQKLDLLNNDFKVQQQKTKPQSLGSAQIEYTIQKMIQDTDDLKDELQKRDGMLKQVEEKNRELQKKVDRFTSTANQLADEKKSALNLGSEEKIDMDRRIAQLQAQLTRIQGEREDVARHLSTTKRLLEISDQDLKAEKGKFQVAAVTFQTNESKLAACDENLIEERSRRKLLESKVATLGDELRGITEALRTKDSQTDDRRRKMEADKLHYNQMMEDERVQAATELRELRQELIDELAIRERRYQDERQRVSVESFERGRAQGTEDGNTEGLLEADQKIQELVLQVQRNKSEVETMKIRLRQSREQADGDQRRLNAQISALQRAVDDLGAQNNTTELEMDSLKTAKSTVEEETFDRISGALRGLSQPIGKKDLLTLLHALRVHRPLDYGFETDRQEEVANRAAIERQEVQQWIRNSLLGNTENPVEFPEMRTRAAPEKNLPFSGDVAASAASGPVTELPQEVLNMIAQSEAQRKEEMLQYDPDVMNQRYRELLTQLNDDNPDLGLIEKKPPPPPPAPPREPTPVRDPTPVREPTPVQERDPTPVREPTPVKEPTPVRTASPDTRDPTPTSPDVPPQKQAAVPLPSVSDSDEEEAPVKAPAPAVVAQKTPANSLRRAPSSGDESDVPAPKPSAKVASPVARGPSPKKGGMFGGSDSESDAAPAPKPAAKKSVARPPSDDEDDAPQQPAPSPKPKAATKSAPAASPKKNTMFADSDSEDEPVAAKPVAPPKRAAPQQKKPTTFADSDESDAAPAAPSPKRGKVAAAPAKKKSMFADSDSDAAPPPKKAAPKTAAKRAAVPKKKGMFDDSD
jgi:hypothetical protein